MALNKKLITFETLAQFQSANGLNTTELNISKPQKNSQGDYLIHNIPYHSIVFIKDTGQIWTHGKYFNCSITSLDLNNKFVTLNTEQIITGNKTFSSQVWIDSLIAGNLTVQGILSGTLSNSLSIQLNNSNAIIFNNSSSKTINITPSSIGAQPAGNYMTTSHPANRITAQNITNWNNIHTWFTTELGDSDTKINKWKEVEAFLNGITDTSTLNGILDQYTKKEADVSFQPVHTNIQSVWSGQFTSTSIPDAKWVLSGNNGLLKDLGTGSYLIQIIHSTDSDGGIYTGYFSYTTGSGTDEEIILHRSGNNSTQRLYAKIKYINSTTCLLLAAKEKEDDCTELTIKMKKLL